ncbi:MAG: hypothetical protein E6Q32_11380 [Neisseriales bacterium]|nr:MAG: hypothetical protein E6Q32_11380 [Neisseriales bacterium]
MKNYVFKQNIIFAALLGIALAGCNGGGATPTPVPTPTPTPGPTPAPPPAAARVPNGASVNTIDVDTEENVIAGTNGGYVYLSRLATESWQLINNIPVPDSGNITKALIQNDRDLYVSTANGNVYLDKYAVESSTWQLIGGSPIPDNDGITYIATTPTDDVIAASFARNVYKSESGTGDWAAVAAGPIPDANGTINTMKATRLGNIAVGTSNGLVYFSSNYGATAWVVAAGGSGLGGTCQAIENIGTRVYAGTTGGLVYYIDVGPNPVMNWTLAGNGALPDHGLVTDLTEDAAGNLYASTAYGYAYILDTGTNSWLQLGNGRLPIDFMPSSATAIDARGRLYAASTAGYVFYTSLGAGESWVAVAAGK